MHPVGRDLRIAYFLNANLQRQESLQCRETDGELFLLDPVITRAMRDPIIPTMPGDQSTSFSLGHSETMQQAQLF
jgi:hypothetical protein